MRYSITFEIIAPEGLVVLTEVVAGLGVTGCHPECLVWSELPGNNEARIWLLCNGDAARMGALRDHFDSHARIRRIFVTPEGPPENSPYVNPA